MQKKISNYLTLLMIIKWLEDNYLRVFADFYFYTEMK